MSAKNNFSFHFYKYLCQKIGSEQEVKVRRCAYMLVDLGIPSNTKKLISSGSKGEGLNLKGSDYDLMYIDPLYKVYELESDAVSQYSKCIPLVMNTEDTHPCFTQLRLLNSHDLIFLFDQTKNTFLMTKLSSELYRLNHLKDISKKVAGTRFCETHGPCISDSEETQDFAFCLKCDQWISQAQSWTIRPRTTWPSPDIISKIISCGVLYVPIGYKGSSNECLQWRISFSVAEKILIFSFNHTQLLCYALLKILIKEIVEKEREKEKDSNKLLCSYFLKTLMFWISEESDPSMWRPDTIIPCFMACFKRLIYCVEYSTLLHYFIPENNLLYLRFDVNKRDKMISILKNLFERGIYCFNQSETLYDFMRLPLKAPDSPVSRLVSSLHEIKNAFPIFYQRPLNLLYHFFLHHSSTKISRRMFFEILSSAHQNVPQISQKQPRSNNKHEYYNYKRDLSHLLIGTNSDAVGGWLLMASFFYVHENYVLSLDIIKHTLSKYAHEKIHPRQISLNQNQEYLLHFLKITDLCTISKSITVKYPNFLQHSPISPQELQLNVYEQNIPFHPTIFAHFLSFLCNYHIHKHISSKQYLLQLRQTIMDQFIINRSIPYIEPVTLSLICLGIAHQMIGDIYSARQCFLQATQFDEHNLTSAAMRLSNCSID